MLKTLAALAAAASLFTTAASAAVPAPAASSKAPAAPAIHWQHKLSDVMVTRADESGKTVHQLDINVLDYFLDTISGYSESDAAELNDPRKHDVVNKLGRLTQMLTELDTGADTDLNVLRREALAYNLAYNLGFQSAQQPTDVLYQRLLQRDADDAANNYLYGTFLAQADTTREKSIGYLDKALKLGVKKANYTLGVVYITQGKDQQALTCLQQYSADYPKDARAPRLIAALKKGDIKRQYQSATGAATH